MSIASKSKRLTGAGTAPLVLALISVIISLIGLLIEPVGYYGHKSEWGIETGVFSRGGLYGYIAAYESIIVLFGLSVLLLVLCVKSFRYKRIGADLGAAVTLISGIMLLTGICKILSVSAEGAFEQTLILEQYTGTDRYLILFDQALARLYHTLPVVSAGLCAAAGTILLIRALRSEHTADCPPDSRYFEDE
ncbi:MAG: hypothetical protein IKN17_00485 [Ruminococcus sp.]|nr:hypothetical protein [Ruminococcus sp.]